MRTDKHDDASSRWAQFIENFQKDIRLTLIFIITFLLFRAFLIFGFSDYLSDQVSLSDIFLAIVIGLRFDAVISAYAALPAVLCSIFGAFYPMGRACERLRNVLLLVFIILSSVTFTINFMFIAEYKDNFNHWIFGVVYDDFGAVAKSVWKDSHILIYFGIAFAIALIATAAGFRLLKSAFISRDALLTRFETRFKKTSVVVILVLCFVFAIRGSIWLRPVQEKDAWVTKDFFLNKLVLNPYSALRYTISAFEKLSKSTGIAQYLPDKDIRSALKLYFSTDQSYENMDRYMAKHAKGKGIGDIDHIFLIVMESMDAWPLEKNYQSLNLLPNLNALGEKGLLIKTFLPASTGTMTSLASIVSGLPDADVRINYQPSARRPYPTSLPRLFKNLGYEVNLFYGGYLAWQHIGDFFKAQGFDNVYGGGSMGNWQNKEWGVDDEALFDFVAKTAGNRKPSFNLILTTANHTPYDSPVYEKGFPHLKMPDDLKNLYNGEVPLKVFGCLWYSDKLLGEFVQKIEKRLPSSLFAVTGDHWSRKFINSNPSLYEKSCVPLLLYGRGVPSPIKGRFLTGSHLDIIPTLIELTAPKGFEYFSMGKNLFDDGEQRISFSRHRVIMPGFIVDEYGNSEKLPFAGADTPAPDTEKILKRLNAYNGIGWWRVINGPNLTEKKPW